MSEDEGALDYKKLYEKILEENKELKTEHKTLHDSLIKENEEAAAEIALLNEKLRVFKGKTVELQFENQCLTSKLEEAGHDAGLAWSPKLVGKVDENVRTSLVADFQSALFTLGEDDEEAEQDENDVRKESKEIEARNDTILEETHEEQSRLIVQSCLEEMNQLDAWLAAPVETRGALALHQGLCEEEPQYNPVVEHVMAAGRQSVAIRSRTRTNSGGTRSRPRESMLIKACLNGMNKLDKYLECPIEHRGTIHLTEEDADLEENPFSRKGSDDNLSNIFIGEDGEERNWGVTLSMRHQDDGGPELIYQCKFRVDEYLTRGADNCQQLIVTFDYMWDLMVTMLPNSPYIPDWMNDDESKACSRCSVPFTFGKRRHHCRTCGLLVCSSCSPNRRVLDNMKVTEHESRLCSLCVMIFDSLYGPPRAKELAPAVNPGRVCNVRTFGFPW